MKKSEFYSLLKSVPKAELHLHEEAVISMDTIKQLYKETNGKEIAQSELDELFSYNDLAGFLDCFIDVQKLFDKIEKLRYINNDLCDYFKDNNIVYSEVFFSPTSHIKKGWSFSEISKIITESVELVKEKTGVTMRIIIDVSRSFGVENAQNNLDMILKENNPYIIGIGLGGDEAKGPAKDFASVFENARKAGLHVVAHAGEVEDSFSMKDSINILHAERIGHGISAAYDVPFMRELAESHIPIEICPTSNIYTKKYFDTLKLHPAKHLFDRGINITVNSDDPTFFKVSLIDEYWNLYKKMGFTIKEIKQLIKNSFKASFITEEEKENYCKLVDEKWNEWYKLNDNKIDK